MALVERRIGLLFAAFLVLLALAGLRATWLGGIRAGDLRSRAVSQQVQEVDVSARRGTIRDRHGVELAVSEDSVTVFANPKVIKDPAGTAARLAPFMGRPYPQVLGALSDRSKGFVYLARKLPVQKGEVDEALAEIGRAHV